MCALEDSLIRGHFGQATSTWVYLSEPRWINLWNWHLHSVYCCKCFSKYVYVSFFIHCFDLALKVLFSACSCSHLMFLSLYWFLLFVYVFFSIACFGKASISRNGVSVNDCLYDTAMMSSRQATYRLLCVCWGSLSRWMWSSGARLELRLVLCSFMCYYPKPLLGHLFCYEPCFIPNWYLAIFCNSVMHMQFWQILFF